MYVVFVMNFMMIVMVVNEMVHIFWMVTIDNMFSSMLCLICFVDSLWVNMMFIVMCVMVDIVVIIMVYFMGAIDEWIIIYKMLEVFMVYWHVTMAFNVWLFKSVMVIVMTWSEVSVIMMSNNTVSIVLWVDSPFAVVSSDSVVSISLIVWPEDFVLYFVSWVDHASSSLIGCLSSVCLSNHMSEWFLMILLMMSCFT
jgi:hypothetical protein